MNILLSHMRILLYNNFFSIDVSTVIPNTHKIQKIQKNPFSRHDFTIFSTLLHYFSSYI